MILGIIDTICNILLIFSNQHTCQVIIELFHAFAMIAGTGIGNPS
jgi:hypothetical protein